MIHFLVIVFFAWWGLNILRSLVRGKPPNPMNGRLVDRNGRPIKFK